MRPGVMRVMLCGIALALSMGSAYAQQPAAAGRPYAPPKTLEGQPDLQGVWRVWNHAADDLESHQAGLGVPAAIGVVEGGAIPYQPSALARKKQNFENSRTKDILKSADPLAKCYMPGVPRITYLPFPFQIFQTAKQVSFLYEWTHVMRIAYLNPKQELLEGVDSYMGTSRARWDGNTLVVDVTGLNDKTWLDAAGNFASAGLHVVERYTPLDPNTLRYEATLEDPAVYTRPWKIGMTLHRQTEQPLLDYECYMLLDESGIPLTWPRD